MERQIDEQEAKRLIRKLGVAGLDEKLGLLEELEKQKKTRQQKSYLWIQKEVMIKKLFFMMT